MVTALSTQPAPPAAVILKLSEPLDALNGVTRLPWAYDLLPLVPTRQTAHKGYQIAILATRAYGPPDKQRNRGSGAALQKGNAVSRVGVRFLYRLRADSQNADYSAALTLEPTIIAAVTNTNSALYQSIAFATHTRWIETTRLVVAEGQYLLSTHVFDVQHYFDIL